VPHIEIARALELARERHTAIAGGDFDAYMARDVALMDVCGRIDAGQVSGEDRPLLDELIGLETQSARLLEDSLRETGSRLAVLRRSARANTAYARAEWSTVNGA
jgi:hypothetical protein